MKSRRGSLWGGGNENMVGQYKAGDVVKPVVVNNLGFVGTVRNVDARINKVWVAWGGGAVSQHDPDEIQLAGIQDSAERAKMASRRTKTASADFFADRASAEANSDARIVSAEKTVFPEGEGPRVAMSERVAAYWCAPERTYRMTRREQENGAPVCPKCRCDMEKEPFTRSEKMWVCPDCRFKVPTGKLTTKRIEIRMDESGEVDVDVTTGKDEELRSRRGRV